MTRTNVYRTEEFEGKVLDGWFDPERAESFDEDLRHSGGDLVSVHTAGKFDHQRLYRTARGRWVLHSWSQWAGGKDVHEFVSDEQARVWLLNNRSDEAVKTYFGELPEECGPGLVE